MQGNDSSLNETVPLVDLGGRACCMPPHGSRFFCFDMQNFQNVAASGGPWPPLTRSTPPLWKILDPPLCTLTIWPLNRDHLTYQTKQSRVTEFTMCTFIRFVLIWWHYFQGTILLLLIPCYSKNKVIKKIVW